MLFPWQYNFNEKFHNFLFYFHISITAYYLPVWQQVKRQQAQTATLDVPSAHEKKLLHCEDEV